MGELVSGWTLDDYTAYQKERLMVTLSNLLENTPDVGEMVHRKIPDIIQPTRQQKIHPHTVTTE